LDFVMKSIDKSEITSSVLRVTDKGAGNGDGLSWSVEKVRAISVGGGFRDPSLRKDDGRIGQRQEQRQRQEQEQLQIPTCGMTNKKQAITTNKRQATTKGRCGACSRN
jgi:hypothetical protein